MLLTSPARTCPTHSWCPSPYLTAPDITMGFMGGLWWVLVMLEM